MTQENTGDSQLAPIYRAPNESVADIVRALLDSEGIPVMIRSHHTHAVYDGMFVAADGYWGDLLVREDQAARAREIILAFESKET